MRNARYPLPVAIMLPIVTAGMLSSARADERLCDTAFENCRTPLLELIRAERHSIDVAFWFMHDGRYVNELIGRFKAGVPVRVLVDLRAETAHPGTRARIDDLAAAGIPIRKKSSGGILHWKTMIFGGQSVVQFSAANYDAFAFVPIEPYVNHQDEVIVFSDDPAVVNSFKRRFDDHWIGSAFVTYRNVTSLTRSYPLYSIHSSLNFPPSQDFGKRSVGRYNAEDVQIDAHMFRITDRRHTDALIAAMRRGVRVRLYTEQDEYRNPKRYWHSWNVDRLFTAGAAIRHRRHAGINHQKSVVLHGQRMVIVGSSNWTSASATSQIEHNYFTTKSWIFNWFHDQFQRKWNNTGPAAETKPFVPLPPDAPVYRSPADGATNQSTTLTLTWSAGLWAHRYDIFLGTSPDPPLFAADVELGPSRSSSDHKKYTVPMVLNPGTTYYWRIVSKTMANIGRSGPVRSYTTSGDAPPPPSSGGDVVLYAAQAPTVAGNWRIVADSTAAGGRRIWNPNANAAKIATAAAAPSSYFEMTFTANAGMPYRLWIRGRAENNHYSNDSVHVQFSDSVTSAGGPQWRIGSTSSTVVALEGCSGCGLSGWGWEDNGWAGAGPRVFFQSTGIHTIRIQTREDGISIDQIVLSPSTYLNASPGAARNDATILPE
jgi:hypothetical protein